MPTISEGTCVYKMSILLEIIAKTYKILYIFIFLNVSVTLNFDLMTVYISGHNLYIIAYNIVMYMCIQKGNNFLGNWPDIQILAKVAHSAP